MKLFLLTGALFSAVLLSGCVSVTERDVLPETPVQLYPAAAKLKGANPASLSLNARQTVADITLHSQTIRNIAAHVDSAVVSIYVKTATPVKVRLIPFNLKFTGIPATLPGVGLGSGFFIHPSGYLLTNEHVIHNATDIRVMTHNGTDYIATLIASDPVYDLALLKVESPNNFKFSFIPMGDSTQVRGGDHVIAVGNPLGFGHTVTAGIVSHTGRSLFEEKDPAGRYVRYIQTDAAINPGSSGGPLISLTGAWIGLNTAQMANSQGIGFTVPSTQVQEFISSILQGTGQQVQ
ncbi:trypsin-like peptidase domain-containing protein [Pontiellaceae bacterium B12227]|nr:trypsin-like peptidase domain-containing protein [Pontiellaceae bacterium B12227]